MAVDLQQQTDLLDAILRQFAGVRIRTTRHNGHTEWWVPCPFHGEHNSNSFSFSERGCKCFACGEQGGLRKLAQQLGLDTSMPAAVYRRPIPRPEPAPVMRDWQRQPDYWRRFVPPLPAALDYYHGRGFSDASIDRWFLGWGVLPSSKCRHPRYILPIFEAGKLVGLKGRRPPDTPCMACDWQARGDCDPERGKWLGSGGTTARLFGLDTLYPGATVIVSESPYGAILAAQEAPYVAAVAPSSGASSWRDEWSKRIAESEPAWALVWYDNDPAGELNAQRVVRSLQAAGIRARRYVWNARAAEKRDLADVVKETKIVPIARPQLTLLEGVPSAYL